MTSAIPTVFRPVRAWWAVGLLLVAYASAFIDRQVLALLVDPIKADLGIVHDWQISLLQGLAFTGTYIAFGPLFGRWADRGTRRNILLFAALLWSICTMLCGLATGFWSLFLARAGVGAAEAALSPVAWTFIADSFPREQLPRALSVYLLGAYLGQGLALLGGGAALGAVQSGAVAGLPIIGALPTWGATFVLVGLPGLITAALLLTLREPVRGAFNPSPGLAADAARNYTLREVLGFLWARRAFFGPFFGGMSLLVLSLYGMPAWLPTSLSRTFGLDRVIGARWYGGWVLVAGCVGVLSGPWLGSRLQARGYRDAMVRVGVIAAMLLVPACLVLAFAPSAPVAIGAGAFAALCYSLPQAMAAGALQVIVPERMRGQVVVVYVFLLTLVGFAVAPTLIALVTDYVFADPTRVGQSIGLVCGTAAAIAAAWMSRALKPFRDWQAAP